MPSGSAITIYGVSSSQLITKGNVSFSATAGNMALEGFSFDPAAGIPAAVPELQTWALMLLGLAALGGTARRRRAV
jgi:MYXO-CTERM domain-containing protein